MYNILKTTGRRVKRTKREAAKAHLTITHLASSVQKWTAHNFAEQARPFWELLVLPIELETAIAELTEKSSKPPVSVEYS